MFGMIDYIVIAGIKQRFQFLSENPRHLYYILQGLYCNPNIKALVGEQYIKEAVECIISQRVHIGPAYNLDMQKLPEITVISSGSEDQQFLGDYGSSSVQKICPPTIFENFDIISIKDNMITTSQDYHLDQKLWNGVFIGNGPFSAQLTAVNNTSDNKTILYLKDAIPEGTPLKGWVSMSDDQYRGVVYSASQDATTTSITLTNSGSYAQHYLYAAVLRYVLKSQRPFFDFNGLQVATMAYSIPVISDQKDQVYQSQFTLQGKFTESWIEREYDLPNAGGKHKFCVSAAFEVPDKDLVDLSCEEDACES